MRVEFDISRKKTISVVVLLLIGAIIGYSFGLTAASPACLPGQANCLTIADLNRQDLGNAITLTRFCEGMGFASSVRWQQDEQGQVYGEPVCIQP